MLRRCVMALYVLGVALSSATGSSAATYTFTDLGLLTLSDGSTASTASAFDINGNGQISGQSLDAFLYNAAAMTNLGYWGDPPVAQAPWPQSIGYGVNSNGHVAGMAQASGQNYYGLANGIAHAFLYANGTKIDLSSSPSTTTTSYAQDLNDNDVVAGYYSPGSYQIAFRWTSGGGMVGIGTLGGNASNAMGINNAGQIVGWAQKSGSTRKPVYWNNGDTTPTELNTLGGLTTSWGMVQRVSENGKAVGESYTSAGNYYHVTRWTLGSPGGAPQDLGTLDSGNPAAVAYGYGINDNGDVVGQSYYPGGGSNNHAFVYTGGTMADLNTTGAVTNLPAGWTLVQARGINSAGQIVGSATYGGQSRAFLLTPVPEPSMLALAAVGLAGLLAYAWRKRT